MTQKTKSTIAWTTTAVVIAVLMFSSYQCGKKDFEKKASLVDTLVVRDTVVIDSKPVPDEEKEDSIVYMVHTEHDTVWGEGIPYPVYIDSSHFPTELVKDYHTKRYYSDDTAGVKIDEVVYKNSIESRKVAIRKSDTMITKNTIYEAPKNIILSFNIAAIGNVKNPLYSQGAELNLQLPNGGTYGAGVYNIKGHPPMFSVRKGWAIKFGKKSKWLPIPTVTKDTTVRASTINIKK